MTFTTKTRLFSNRGGLRAAMAAGVCCGLWGLASPAPVGAQDIAGGASDPIEDRLSPGNVEDTIEGRGPGNDGQVIEQGFRGGVQDAFGGRPSAPVVGQPLNRGLTQNLGQSYYRDAQGRFFFLDPQGARVYIDTQRPVAPPMMRPMGPQQAPQGPQLGVMITDSPDGIRIDQVESTSVAADAGLQSGDVLVQFNGQQVNDPRQLQQLVQSVSPGESVEITVLRNGEEQTLTAAFPEQGDRQRYGASKPAMDGSQLQQELEQLRSEVESLRQQMNRLHGQQNNTGQGRPSPPQPSDANEDQQSSATQGGAAQADAASSEAQSEAVRAKSNEKAELSPSGAEAEGESEAETSPPASPRSNPAGDQSSS